MTSSAVVLVSGGLDSATALAVARSRGLECHALSFDYSQRHVVELDAARVVAKALGATSHRVVEVDLRAFGGSALTTDDIAVPREGTDGIPVTYVPARNTIFLSFALAFAEIIGAREIFIGANAVDYSGYPDCRPEFIEAFERLANLATKVGVEGESFHVRAPLMAMTKAEIIREGIRLGVDYGLTWSCYDPRHAPGGPRACGACDSCRIRRRGFVDAGVPDPTPYV